MIPDRNFIRDCARRKNRELSPHMEEWLLIHFSDELYPGQYDESLLEDLIVLYCDSYNQGNYDFPIPSPTELLTERYEDAKDFILDLMDTAQHYEKLCATYEDRLRKYSLL
jgi:hypothetical protein